MKSACKTSTVPLPATITGRRELSGDTTLFSLMLGDTESAQNFTFTPGQFIQLSVPGSGEAPISLASPPSDNGAMELCVRRVGHVTEMLHKLGIGNQLGIRGPYGNGFPVTGWQGKNILLIAGGLGIAPLRSLLYFLLSRRNEFGTITVTYGAREPSALLFKEELAGLSARPDIRLFLTVDLATDEPPLGLVCNTGLLPELLNEVNITAQNIVAAVCGPPALYRCVIDELQGYGFTPESIFLSLERRMKCGVGLCCHCAVGNLFCCTDGPVFRYADIQGIRGAL
jgi:sulfhydrogenase subunit gamma (sulfur reductase)